MRNIVVVLSLTLWVSFVGERSAHAQGVNGSILIADGFAAANTCVGPYQARTPDPQQRH